MRVNWRVTRRSIANYTVSRVNQMHIGVLELLSAQARCQSFADAVAVSAVSIVAPGKPHLLVSGCGGPAT